MTILKLGSFFRTFFNRETVGSGQTETFPIGKNFVVGQPRGKITIESIVTMYNNNNNNNNNNNFILLSARYKFQVNDKEQYSYGLITTGRRTLSPHGLYTYSAGYPNNLTYT